MFMAQSFQLLWHLCYLQTYLVGFERLGLKGLWIMSSASSENVQWCVAFYVITNICFIYVPLPFTGQ